MKPLTAPDLLMESHIARRKHRYGPKKIRDAMARGTYGMETSETHFLPAAKPTPSRADVKRLARNHRKKMRQLGRAGY